MTARRATPRSGDGTLLAEATGLLAGLAAYGLPVAAPLPAPAGLAPRVLSGGFPALLEGITAWLGSRDHGRNPRASARLSELVSAAPVLDAGLQVIHGDYRAANLLVEDSRIVGVLDLDEIRRNHPMADIAQSSTYLATLFRDWGPTTAPIRAALREGYASVSPLDEAREHWLELLTLWMGLRALPDGDDPHGWAKAL